MIISILRRLRSTVLGTSIHGDDGYSVNLILTHVLIRFRDFKHSVSTGLSGMTLYYDDVSFNADVCIPPDS
jgi:hypothetical protein